MMNKVPNGWTSSTVGVHINLISGFPFKSDSYTDNEQDIRLLRGDNIEPLSLRWKGVKKWPLSALDTLKNYCLEQGDIVIAMDRTWVSAGLKVAEVKQMDLPCLLVQRVARLRSKPSLVQSFLKQLFITLSFEQYVKGVQTETAVPHISSQQIKDFPILVPPLPEQIKIASILSTWDNAINTVQKLLANSQQQKKALMQQLLTGKKRFSGFEGEWGEVKLSSIAEILVSPVDKKSNEGEIAVLLCNYTDVYYNGRIRKNMNFMSATASQREIERFSLKLGDVIITKDSETPNDIAIPSYVCEELDGVVCGYHLAIIRPRKNRLDGEYLSYLFSLQRSRYYFFTRATGATRFGLSVGGIENALFLIPSLPEQQKIAAILTIADQEIDNLRAQLNQLKQEKKALMQQLLTGKRRVKIEEAA